MYDYLIYFRDIAKPDVKDLKVNIIGLLHVLG